MKKSFIQELKERLATSKKIVILPHRNADGDALGSTLALKHFLKQKKHQVKVVSPNDYPSFLKWLPGENDVLKYNQTPKLARDSIREADLIFTLDFNALSRIEDLTNIVRSASGEKIMIDHHEDPEDYAKLNYSDHSMSSTCEMIYNVIKALDEQFREIARETEDLLSCKKASLYLFDQYNKSKVLSSVMFTRIDDAQSRWVDMEEENMPGKSLQTKFAQFQ